MDLFPAEALVVNCPLARERDQLKDVCLEFCFDQLSATGYLYSNHRCFNDGHGQRCR